MVFSQIQAPGSPNVTQNLKFGMHKYNGWLSGVFFEHITCTQFHEGNACLSPFLHTEHSSGHHYDIRIRFLNSPKRHFRLHVHVHVPALIFEKIMHCIVRKSFTCTCTLYDYVTKPADICDLINAPLLV